MSSAVPASLLAALEALTASLSAANIPAVVIGGVAASLLGRPRRPQDIDVLVDAPEDRWPDIITAARPFDIEPRISEPLEFSRRARVLLLRHGASQIDIEVILGVLPFPRVTARRFQPTSRARSGLAAAPLPRCEKGRLNLLSLPKPPVFGLLLVEDEPFSLRMDERRRQFDHVPTEAEKADKKAGRYVWMPRFCSNSPFRRARRRYAVLASLRPGEHSVS